MGTTFADVDNDGDQDLYVVSGGPGRWAYDTNLRDRLFLNDGNARFKFEPLPRIAQFSPGFGIVLTEVDGDGNTDLYFVQNFHGPQPETGHMNGGVSLLLLGAGNGRFAPVWPNRSGRDPQLAA